MRKKKKTNKTRITDKIGLCCRLRGARSRQAAVGSSSGSISAKPTRQFACTHTTRTDRRTRSLSRNHRLALTRHLRSLRSIVSSARLFAQHSVSLSLSVGPLCLRILFYHSARLFSLRGANRCNEATQTLDCAQRLGPTPAVSSLSNCPPITRVATSYEKPRHARQTKEDDTGRASYTSIRTDGQTRRIRERLHLTWRDGGN